MKLLTSLNPQWTGVLRPGAQSGEGITFDCPECGPKHRLCAYFKNPRDGNEPNGWTPKWERTGVAFGEMTISPSLDYPCWHGWIESGIAYSVGEAPFALHDPRGRVIALSPNQSEQFANEILQRVAALRLKAGERGP